MKKLIPFICIWALMLLAASQIKAQVQVQTGNGTTLVKSGQHYTTNAKLTMKAATTLVVAAAIEARKGGEIGVGSDKITVTYSEKEYTLSIGNDTTKYKSVTEVRKIVVHWLRDKL